MTASTSGQVIVCPTWCVQHFGLAVEVGDELQRVDPREAAYVHSSAKIPEVLDGFGRPVGILMSWTLTYEGTEVEPRLLWVGDEMFTMAGAFALCNAIEGLRRAAETGVLRMASGGAA